jgi:hypothetical protein
MIGVDHSDSEHTTVAGRTMTISLTCFFAQCVHGDRQDFVTDTPERSLGLIYMIDHLVSSPYLICVLKELPNHGKSIKQDFGG